MFNLNLNYFIKNILFISLNFDPFDLTDMEVVVTFLYFDVDLHIWAVYNIPFDLYRHQLVVQDNYKTLHKLFVVVEPLLDFENCVEYGDDDKHKSKKML